MSTRQGTVPSDDEYRVDCRVLKDRFRGGSGIGKSELPLRVDSRERAACRDMSQLYPRLIREVRKEHRRGIVPGSDEADTTVPLLGR